MWKRRNFDQIEKITFFKSELKQGPKGYLKVKCCEEISGKGSLREKFHHIKAI